ncbi:MAG: pseudaminic acid synthase [Sphingomonadales bacterium CG12_big_fil_rev_8_21_14_0_65_65_10]|uniref:pseudaminic acid synthase n=1 Tax=Blastomonas marina TaxID=1867408 RepID=UPI000CA7B75B|nr:pseudaminic acid synthase [Blastomonas marina]PIW54460.1 MAG: pseudaminic acid synthase [Sphingomonadales bacterium CG12_big_fil_rev_8_21_14_0_65_65_10]WPZ03424.1 pseudaminic acid synthase [Blastomonas marina]
MQINGRTIGLSERPYLIAEMSGNHNHSLDRALEIVTSAAEHGADAIKLQTYTADTITLDVDGPGFTIEDENSLWNGRRLHELYDEAHTPWDWHKPIMDHAKSLGIDCFSSPFDASAVDFLEELDVPAYKIASFESIDLPLIRKVAETGKPMIISTGMASVVEIGEALRAAHEAGNEQVCILKCTSTYPATPENTNIRTIPNMRDTFGCEVGLSDHTMGTGVSVAATALGAVLIEKHFTLARADGGVDSAFSLEPHELQQLRDETERAWQSLGQVTYGGTKAESGSRQFRRSLYVAEDMVEGEQFTETNLRSVRPGYGLAPKHYDVLLGKRVNRALTKGTPVSWDLIA